MTQLPIFLFVLLSAHSVLSWPEVGTLTSGGPSGTGAGSATASSPQPPPASSPPPPPPSNVDTKPKASNFEANAGMLRSATDFLYSYLPGRQNTEKLELLILAISDLRAEIRSLKMELGDLGMRIVPKTPTTSDSLLPSFNLFNKAQ